MSDNKAILIIADSERDSNIYYATGFMAPDPFVYIQHGNGKIMITSDLELDRARSQSKVDKVLSLSKYERIVKKREGKPSGFIGVVTAALREMKIKKLLVPADFNVEYADFLRKKGFKLEVKKEPFFASREIKDEEGDRAHCKNIT